MRECRWCSNRSSASRIVRGVLDGVHPDERNESVRASASRKSKIRRIIFFSLALSSDSRRP